VNLLFEQNIYDAIAQVYLSGRVFNPHFRIYNFLRLVNEETTSGNPSLNSLSLIFSTSSCVS